MLKEQQPVYPDPYQKNGSQFNIDDELPVNGLVGLNSTYELNPESDVPFMHSWFLDAAHCTPPVTPMFGWHWTRFCTHGLKTACVEMSIPACRGWEVRLYNNRIYFSLNIIRDTEEIARREFYFKRALQPWLDDFDGLWTGYKRELLGIYNRLKECDVDRATNAELFRHNIDLMLAYRRMWEIHFLGMYASFSAWYIFENITGKRFGLTDLDPGFQDMMRGFDNQIYEMDKKLFEFKQLALDMGLEKVFRNTGQDTIIRCLQQSEKGRQWYGKFMNFLHHDEVGGWRMTRFSDLTEPYWLEKPAIPLALIKDQIIHHSRFDLQNTREKISRKRETAIARFMDGVAIEERESISGILKLAGKVSFYNEEHDLYCELMAHSLMRRGYLAIGRRLARARTINIPEDVFMLNPEEIGLIIINPEAYDLRQLAGRRKARWTENCRNLNPPTFFTDRGNLAEAIKMDVLPSQDAIAIKAMVGPPCQVNEPGGDLCGVCGCAGEVIGVARVVFTYEDLNKVEPGDILVCPAANPAWTPVFGKINGVISDNGGVLCHTAIIGREYGLPTIVNTRNGTRRIKSGDRIRLDATRGVVYLLD